MPESTIFRNRSGQNQSLAIPRLWSETQDEDAERNGRAEDVSLSIHQADAAVRCSMYTLFAERISRQLQRNAAVALTFSVLLAGLGGLIADRLILVAALTYGIAHLMNEYLMRLAVHNISQSFE